MMTVRQKLKVQSWFRWTFGLASLFFHSTFATFADQK